MMKLSKQVVETFQNGIWDFYEQHGRQFDWRYVEDPYHVVVSEIMLQQTQTYRVINKFRLWISRFPTFEALAQASLYDVLAVWQGLGYNRRGMYLHETAKRVVAEYNGIVPCEPDVLKTFPGIGPATAASICAFAYNEPTVFIETNIRTVFIHHFFQKKKTVHDQDIMPLVMQTLEKSNPRSWYYALMDYGVMLKKNAIISHRNSAHYTKQSRFEGSDRQIRGKVLRCLLKGKTVALSVLKDEIACSLDRLRPILKGMQRDGLITIEQSSVAIR